MPKGQRLCDYHDIVVRMAANGATHQRIADYLGFSRDGVERYFRKRGILLLTPLAVTRRENAAAGTPDNVAYKVARALCHAEPEAAVPNDTLRAQIARAEREWTRLLDGRRFDDHPIACRPELHWRRGPPERSYGRTASC